MRRMRRLQGSTRPRLPPCGSSPAPAVRRAPAAARPSPPSSSSSSSARVSSMPAAQRAGELVGAAGRARRQRLPQPRAEPRQRRWRVRRPGAGVGASSASAASTSRGCSAGRAPSASSALVPMACRRRGGRARASTSRPELEGVARAVISEPERTAASTTSVARVRAAMNRLRIGKCSLSGGVPERQLGDERAARGDGPRELAVVDQRVAHVEAAAEHRDGAAAAVERAAVRGPVDAPSEAGDDRDAAARELAREPARGLATVVGGASRADDGHPRIPPAGRRGSRAPAAAARARAARPGSRGRPR